MSVKGPVAAKFKQCTLPFPIQTLVFTCLQYKSFENTVGKGEIAHNEQFLLFPLYFPSFWISFSHVYQISNCCLQTVSVWTILKLFVWERVKFKSNYGNLVLLKCLCKVLALYHTMTHFDTR